MASQNLFVGSLPYATTDDTLLAHFQQIGPVTSARVITDRDSGRSKGFGFVEMSDDTQARAAIEALNGQNVAVETVAAVLSVSAAGNFTLAN